MRFAGALRSRGLKKRAVTGLTLVVLFVFVATIVLFLDKPKVHAQTFLVSGTTWTVPPDWTSTNNTIEVIGGGGGAGGGFTDLSGSGGGAGGGGGGGAYSKASNVTLAPGDTVTISVGSAGTGGIDGVNGVVGGDTYLCNSTTSCTSISGSAVVVGAKGGGFGGAGASTAGGAGGTGGLAASGVGSLKNNGGSGGAPSGPASAAGSGGGGGGGAAGSSAVGNNGAANTTTTAGTGGRGDGVAGGTGGTGNGGAGNIGTEYDSSHGSGGGAAGGNGIGNGSGSPGGVGGAYGAAGGGGGGNGSKKGTGGLGGNGNQGLIRVVYNYTAQSDYRWRSDDGSETTGTALANQNTPASIISTSQVRLRLGVINQGDATAYSYRLEYAPYDNGCGTWTAVPDTATTEHFAMYNTANYTDQQTSANVAIGPGVLTDPSGSTFIAGKLVKTPSNEATSLALTGLQFTELEYSIKASSNAVYPTYCFRVTNSGTPLEGYNNYPILNINYVPSVPTLYSVANGATNTSRLPFFQLRSTDNNADYLKYVVETCPTNSWPCGGGGLTYDQTITQTCWNQQDSQTSTAFASSGILLSSTMAYCQVPVADMLPSSTTYYMRAKAIDLGGSNTYSEYTAVSSFTTAALDIQIKGSADIKGGTQIGN